MRNTDHFPVVSISVLEYFMNGTRKYLRMYSVSAVIDRNGLFCIVRVVIMVFPSLNFILKVRKEVNLCKTGSVCTGSQPGIPVFLLCIEITTFSNNFWKNKGLVTAIYIHNYNKTDMNKINTQINIAKGLTSAVCCCWAAS